MQTALFPELDAPADARQAYLVRGQDLRYYAKRSSDGEVICADEEKIEAMHAAENLGFYFSTY